MEMKIYRSGHNGNQTAAAGRQIRGLTVDSWRPLRAFGAPYRPG